MNFVDVKDCATGHVLAMEKGRSGERYILGGRNMELAEFFVKLEKDNFHKLALPLTRWLVLISLIRQSHNP